MSGADTGPRAGGCLTPVSWEAAERLTFEGWVAQGRRIGAIGRAVGWWIGDWLRYGNARYGERYARAARLTGYDAQTLMNMAYVASRFEISRRREKLSWSHHAEVAALPPHAQDAWLERAEDERLSVRCLREEMRRVRRIEHAGSGGQRADAALVCPECGHTFSEPVEREAA
jgi:anaerobic selenocysteine-containing dehydrogenase